MKNSPGETILTVTSFFGKYGFSSVEIIKASRKLHDAPEELLKFLMRNHHEVAEPEQSRPIVCAITIGTSYFLGGFIPILPYLCIKTDLSKALHWSIGIMAITLFVFGWVKNCVNSGWRGRKNVRAGIKGSIEMIAIGGGAAAAAYGVVLAFNRNHNA